MCLSFQSNTELQSLNLSWNGFGMEGCHEMGKTLKTNKSLTELDLSSNRVCFDAFRLLLQGLVNNTTLQILKVFLCFTCSFFFFFLPNGIYPSNCSNEDLGY